MTFNNGLIYNLYIKYIKSTKSRSSLEEKSIVLLSFIFLICSFSFWKENEDNTQKNIRKEKWQIEVRGVFRHCDYKTENQWNKLKKKIKPNCEGVELWTNGYCVMTCFYYSPDQVEDMTEEEYNAYKDKVREKARENYKKEKYA